MCDMSYEDQLVDNHCMNGPGITEFPASADKVYSIYCHKHTDTVIVQIKDSGGGLHYVNHPDGETYEDEACESLLWWPRNGIPSAGSPYFTSASWPEGPFTGVGAGIEWYIGLFVAFDQEHYYGNNAEAVVSARDPAASIGPTTYEAITVTISSSSDPAGIELQLREEIPSFPVFRSVRPLRFSQIASNSAEGVIKVTDHDLVTVSYCPRDCKEPYTDTAVWYQLEATITPTPLPTWPGPPPSATPTPPPELDVSYLVLRPAPADVGYVPQISTNLERPNHLGYPSVYSGTWTRGRNIHYGMIQFELSPLPDDAEILSARLDITGRESRFAEPGTWRAQVLDAAVDANWRSATFDVIDTASVVAAIGEPLAVSDLAVGRVNSLGFGRDQLALLSDRAATTDRLSIRIAGPVTDDNNLFAWQSGVDVYGRESEPPDPALGPALYITYADRGDVIEPTPTESYPDASPTRAMPTIAPTATPSPSPSPSATLSLSPTPGSTTPSPVPTGTSESDGRTLCVLAWDDADGDGSRDPHERLLRGLTVTLTHLPSAAYVRRTTDGANDPDYCWAGLSDGAYKLSLTGLPDGYEATTAVERSLEIPFPFSPVSFAFGAREAARPTTPAAPSETPHASSTPTGSPTAERGNQVYLPLLASE